MGSQGGQQAQNQSKQGERQPGAATRSQHCSEHPEDAVQTFLGSRAASRQLRAELQTEKQVQPLHQMVRSLSPESPRVQGKPRFRGVSQEWGGAASGLVVQPKLTIGAPGDKYEQEADRVAHQVVQQIQSPQLSQVGTGIEVQRQVKEDEAELQRKSESLLLGEAVGGMAASGELEASIRQARGGGAPLPEAVREPMEQAFGADFSGVRIHTNAKADELNRSIQAKAFTTQQDIFLSYGTDELATMQGKQLLAHELVHVMQQNAGAANTHRRLSYLQRFPIYKVVGEKSELVGDTKNDDDVIKIKEWLRSFPSSTEALHAWRKQKVEAKKSGYKEEDFNHENVKTIDQILKEWTETALNNNQESKDIKTQVDPYLKGLERDDKKDVNNQIIYGSTLMKRIILSDEVYQTTIVETEKRNYDLEMPTSQDQELPKNLQVLMVQLADVLSGLQVSAQFNQIVQVGKGNQPEEHHIQIVVINKPPARTKVICTLEKDTEKQPVTQNDDKPILQLKTAGNYELDCYSDINKRSLTVKAVDWTEEEKKLVKKAWQRIPEADRSFLTELEFVRVSTMPKLQNLSNEGTAIAQYFPTNPPIVCITDQMMKSLAPAFTRVDGKVIPYTLRLLIHELGHAVSIEGWRRTAMTKDNNLRDKDQSNSSESAPILDAVQKFISTGQFVTDYARSIVVNKDYAEIETELNASFLQAHKKTELEKKKRETLTKAASEMIAEAYSIWLTEPEFLETHYPKVKVWFDQGLYKEAGSTIDNAMQTNSILSQSESTHKTSTSNAIPILSTRDLKNIASSSERSVLVPAAVSNAGEEARMHSSSRSSELQNSQPTTIPFSTSRKESSAEGYTRSQELESNQPTSPSVSTARQETTIESPLSSRELQSNQATPIAASKTDWFGMVKQSIKDFLIGKSIKCNDEILTSQINAANSNLSNDLDRRKRNIAIYKTVTGLYKS